MGKEGLKGVYKGNLTGMIYTGINAKLRTWLYAKAMEVTMDGNEKDKIERDFVKENLISNYINLYII
jgi:hypothetical protein